MIAGRFKASMLRGLAAMGTLVAVACSTTPEAPRFPVPSYDDVPPIRLDVATIEVVQSYEPPLAKPNVEHVVPLSPANAARAWARDRLLAVGERGTATLDIHDAAVIKKDLKTEGGLSGLLTTEPAARHTARLALELKVARPDGSNVTATVQGTRETVVLEGAAINKRRKTLYKLVTKLMNDVDARMIATLRETLDGCRPACTSLERN